MRTGKYILSLYQEERKRIVQEFEDVLPALNGEKEIIEIQKGVKVHNTYNANRMLVHFNCGGGIGIDCDLPNGKKTCVMHCYERKAFDFHIILDQLTEALCI